VETNGEILRDAAWSLSSIASSDAGAQGILSQNVVPKLIELLSHPDTAVKVPCLRLIGNLISGADEQASVVLKEKNLIQEMFKLVENPKQSLRKEVFWALSNITKGAPVQFEALMGNPVYVKKIIHAATNDVRKVKKEALLTLSNSTGKCTPAQILRILNDGVFGCFIELLDEEEDPKLLCAALEGIDNCLKWGEQFNIKDESGVNKFVAEMESKGGVEKIEYLTNNENNDVYEKTCKIIETYFAGEEDVNQ